MATDLISSALYDATKAAVFSKRNIDKTANGDIGRAAVAAGQIRNAVGAVAKFDNGIGEFAKNITTAFDKSANNVSFIRDSKKLADIVKQIEKSQLTKPGKYADNLKLSELFSKAKIKVGTANAIDGAAKGSSVLGYTAKAVNLASKAVNPLICVSAGIRVARSNDKTSEAINQVYALSSMFAAEKTAKLFLTPEGREKLVKLGFGDKGISKTLMKAFTKLDKLSTAAGASKYAKFGIPILKGVGFVAASISGYALGDFIAGKINNSLKKQKVDCKA